ncbi:hypothetical protein [Bosea sp. (in: a-proteobacteria)]|uniref:hypothetical protein n=1 Tax=Bosea sp. (in: a-proteobacteria) TaxID=1871050 RepID=UPI00262D3EB6|nr:hypothetical protein [Bosea sp. (in: a-proteobacteria)]MCO5092088.1 hypothetical protein [Bosea sp. (in: a-proteobacteria)]
MTGEMVNANALDAAMTAYSEQTQGQPDRQRLSRAIVAYISALPGAPAETPGVGADLTAFVDHWRDRALAAEAALAAERERVDQLHATIRKAHVAMTMACALPGVASEYDFSEAIASTEATLARRAAAIRAEE